MMSVRECCVLIEFRETINTGILGAAAAAAGKPDHQINRQFEMLDWTGNGQPGQLAHVNILIGLFSLSPHFHLQFMSVCVFRNIK